MNKMIKPLLIFLLLLGSATAGAQDTLYIEKHDTIWIDNNGQVIQTSYTKPTKYEQRVNRYRNRWQVLIPSHSKLQFAGNMGLLSIGPGWDYGRHDQWETDLLFGFVPKYDSKKTKVTMTVKQTFNPWTLPIKDGPVSVDPLSCGLYLNTIFGEEFWVNEPDRFPKGYYGFASKVRIHVFLGQRISIDIPQKYRRTTRKATFFYELSTCDLYMVSAFTNKYLKPRDYLSLSFGLKMQWL